MLFEAPGAPDAAPDGLDAPSQNFQVETYSAGLVLFPLVHLALRHQLVTIIFLSWVEGKTKDKRKSTYLLCTREASV